MPYVPLPRLSTGISGLDEVLHGGFPAGRTYLIEGDPGTGKTTLGMQFLIAGVEHGEKGLYITLAESREEIYQVAASHGIDLSQIEVAEVRDTEKTPENQDYTVFHPAEVELSDVMEAVIRKIEELSPARVVIDSMSEFRMLAREVVRYRRQVLSLKEFLTGRNCTTLLLDDRSPSQTEVQLQTVTHGVIRLESLPREYGIKRRRLDVIKIRASQFREGYHDYVIDRGGLRVFPRLVSREHREQDQERPLLPSGIAELDSMFDGGIDRGSATLVLGPAGCGKSTICAKFAVSAAERGERAAIFTFDELPRSMFKRCTALGIPLRKHVESGAIYLQQIDPAELSPGEFIERVASGVVENDWSVVVIDSLNGLLNAMAGEHALTVQLHELLSYLNQMGVASFLVMAQHGLLGHAMVSPADVSYLADNVMLLRYFEARGEVRQAISVVKRRGGSHEKTIREMVMNRNSLRIGEPLSGFRGVLSGTPEILR